MYRSCEMVNNKFNLFLRATITTFGLSQKSRKHIYNVLKSQNILKEESLNLSNWPFEIKKTALEQAITEHEEINSLSSTSLISIFEDVYPDRLREIPDAPLQLFIRGEIPRLREISNSSCLLTPAIGVVGTRNADNYGLKIAQEFSKELSSQGVWIISGLARGVDSAAHHGALEACGNKDTSSVKTIAVFGCGLNYVYPRENRQLAQEITDRGGVLISEYGLNEKPRKHFFPERNRIISGLSDAVWVVEAAKRSGSIITANQAAEQGREVLASPGRAGDYLSEGSNNLIKNGAAPVTELADLFYALKFEREEKIDSESIIKKQREYISSSNLRLLDLIKNLEQVHFDELLIKSKQTASELSLSLVALESAGLINQLPGDYYEKC